MPKSGKPSDQNLKQIRRVNMVESLREIGDSTKNSLKQDVVKGIPKDIFDQVFSAPKNQRTSGEFAAGETLAMREVVNQETKRREKVQEQLIFERRLREEEKIYTESKARQLRVQLSAVIEEVAAIARTTQGLAHETEIAYLQAPIEPGIYHLTFFEMLLTMLKNYRKRITESVEWLRVSNKRAQKKSFWGTYKKLGGKFLLSGEHYSQRSAG